MAQAVFVKLGTAFDMDRLVVSRPERRKSKIYAMDGETPKKLMFEFEEVEVKGLRVSHPYGMREKDKTSANINGVFVPYDVWNAPQTRKILDEVYSRCLDQIMPFMESEEVFMSEEYKKSYARAKSRNNWTMFLKPFVKYGTVNINLRTKDDGSTLKFLTRTIDGEKREVSPLQFTNERCRVHPVIVLEEIYFGKHGSNPHGASIRCSITEMQILPADEHSSDNDEEIMESGLFT